MSSNTTVLNVKIDRDLKSQAQEVASALGLPVSTLVSASLRDIVRRRSITISDEPVPRPEVIKEIRKISAAARKNIDVSPSFGDVDESITWLKAEIAKEH